MAKYELNQQQVKLLQVILANAQIRGADAPAIIELANALQKPIAEKEKPNGLRKEAEGK